MAYSNGYDLTAATTALFGRLGWSESTLSVENKTSKSGRKFDDGSFHSVVSVANIKSVFPAQQDSAAWNTAFTTLQQAVIARCLNTVFNINEAIEQVHLYDRITEDEQTLDLPGRAIGYRIRLASKGGHTVRINTATFYLDSAATFNLYLFAAGNSAAIKTASVTSVANQKTTIQLDDWFLSRKEGTVFYIVYFQDDLAGGKAIQEQVCWNRTLVFGADSIDAVATGATTFERNELGIRGDSAGLNLHVSGFVDHTQNIVNQPWLFDNLLGLAMACQVAEAILYSQRSNKDERQIKHNIDQFGLMLDLSGTVPITDAPHIFGLRQRFEKEAARVREAFYPKPKAKTVILC